MKNFKQKLTSNDKQTAAPVNTGQTLPPRDSHAYLLAEKSREREREGSSAAPIYARKAILQPGRVCTVAHLLSYSLSSAAAVLLLLAAASALKFQIE